MAPRPVPLVLGLALVVTAAVILTSGPRAEAGETGLRGLNGTTGLRGPNGESGAELYATGCASCHGADGEGVRIIEPAAGLGEAVTGPAAGPGELRGPSLQESGAAAAYYYLATGRMPLANPDDQPRRKEPAYDAAAIDALVAHVATLGEGPPVPEVDLAGADVAHGGELYRRDCQACHSAFGSGGALSYGRAAPNLHSADPLEVAAAARAGPGQMPVFGPDTVGDDELDDLVAYVAYLRTPQNPGGAQIGRNGPVPEGFVAWGFGIGLLLLVVAWVGGRSPVSTDRPDEEVS